MLFQLELSVESPKSEKTEKPWAQSDLEAKNAKGPSEPVKKLLAIGRSIVTAKAHQPKDGKTFCNFAVAMAALAYGYDGLVKKDRTPLLANDMINVLAGSK